MKTTRIGSPDNGVVIRDDLAAAVRSVIDKTQGAFRLEAERAVDRLYSLSQQNWPVDTGRSKRAIRHYSRVGADGKSYVVGWGVYRVSYLVYIFAPFKSVEDTPGAKLTRGRFLPQAFRALIKQATDYQAEEVDKSLSRDLQRQLR